jgi:aminopeptidase N
MSPSGRSLEYPGNGSLEELDNLKDKIVLNSHELVIHEAVIKASETKTESTIKAKHITYDDKARTATLDFGQKIRHSNGKSFLSLRFDGILNNAMAGFYRSAYVDANGENKYMFSTQCEVRIPPLLY